MEQKNTMRKHRKRTALFVLVFLLAAALLGGCRKFDALTYITDILGVDVHQAEILYSQDSHGGFLGDGLLAVTFSYSTDQAQEIAGQLADQPGWHPFPLSENVERALYGTDHRTHTTTAPIRDDSTDALLVPRIENGWYFFYDRFYDRDSEPTDPLDDSNLFSRSSFNCTVAVFDTDTGLLYFFELDT